MIIKTAERCQVKKGVSNSDGCFFDFDFVKNHGFTTWFPVVSKEIGVKWTHPGPGGFSGRYLGPAGWGTFRRKRPSLPQSSVTTGRPKGAQFLLNESWKFMIPT